MSATIAVTSSPGRFSFTVKMAPPPPVAPFEPPKYMAPPPPPDMAIVTVQPLAGAWNCEPPAMDRDRLPLRGKTTAVTDGEDDGVGACDAVTDWLTERLRLFAEDNVGDALRLRERDNEPLPLKETILDFVRDKDDVLDADAERDTAFDSEADDDAEVDTDRERLPLPVIEDMTVELRVDDGDIVAEAALLPLRVREADTEPEDVGIADTERV